MRCYLMRDGHIAAVELLSSSTDETRIAEAREIFESNQSTRQFDGYEVWEGARFIYRWPAD
jgi:hypothetical protein